MLLFACEPVYDDFYFLFFHLFYLFKRQPYKMVKQTQTICWLPSMDSLSVIHHFVGLAFKGLMLSLLFIMD